MTSLLDEFRYENPSPLTVDGITVLSVLNEPSGRWVRKFLPHPVWAAQTTWNLDSAGNPEGDGIGTPVPALEYYRRTGPKRILPGVGQLHLNLVNGDLDRDNDPLILSIAGALVPSQIVITGTAPQVLATGTLNSYSGHVVGNNNFNQITNTGLTGTDWTPFVDKLIRLTSGPHANQGASFVLFNKGSGVAYTDDWYYPDDANFVHAQPEFSPAGNETYEVLELQDLGQVIVDCSASGSQNMNPRNVTITLQYVKTPSGFNGFFAPNMMFFRQCDLVNMFVVGPNAQIWVSNCAWTGAAAGVVQGAHCGTQGGHVAAPVKICDGDWYFDDNPIMRDGGFFPPTTGTLASPSFLRIHGGMGFLNCTPQFAGAIVPLDQGSHFGLRGYLWGEGNTGNLIALSGARCFAFAFAAPVEGVGVTGFVFSINGKTILRAYDDSTGAYTSDHRDTTVANFAAAVSSGGFGGQMFDPAQPISGVFTTEDA